MGIRISYRGVYILLGCGADGNPHRITMEIERNRHSGPDKADTVATTYINGSGAHQARLHKRRGGDTITGNYSNLERRNTVKYAKKIEKLGE